MDKRGSGILLHVTSLPSPYGIGDLGPGARRFVDFLSRSKQSFWQILPLCAINTPLHTSPYLSMSVFAGNKLLISPELLVKEEYLEKDELEPVPYFPKGKVDHYTVHVYKKKLFQKAYSRFKKRKKEKSYEKFCAENSGWLEDFSLFISLKGRYQQKSWIEWPSEVRNRKPVVLEELKRTLRDEMEKEKFLQYVFYQQWGSLRDYCLKKKVHIIGDLPIYTDYDSADVWTHPEIFKLNRKKRPYVVSGVPPGYSSRTGQRWGSPVYDWSALKRKEYDWWIHRLEHNFKLYDIVRIDHFRGFVAYWEVPAAHRTAARGKWVKAPAKDFFTKLKKRFPGLPIIAEDLGHITADVKEVMQRFGLSGMKVLLFAFGKNHCEHPFLPHNYEKNCVAYTGTHDNNTVKGWFAREATPAAKKRVIRYIGRNVSAKNIHWEFIRLAMMSVANKVIIPMQDVLGLGEEARMNLPATTKGNWEWRLLPQQLGPELAKKLSEMTEISKRA
jgi:4-alpha-glucanotransferase